jgi:lipopolysaccharide/colanic/teichoic acid biosynthesis glycosyltransferase
MGNQKIKENISDRSIAVPFNEKSLEGICAAESGRIPRMNHYAKRTYELPIVLTSIIPAAALTILGAAAVKLEDAYLVIKGEAEFSRLYANPFYVQKVVMWDDSERSQIKIRSMEPNAHLEYEKMKKKGIVRPGVEKLIENNDSPEKKYIPDPRITRLGRIMRKYSYDEIPQLVQLGAQYLTRGLFHSETNDNFYFFGNRPQTRDSIKNAKPKDREKLRAGPFGLFSLDCVGRGKPGHDRESDNNLKYSEAFSKENIWLTDWYIFKNAPKVILGGKNS